MYKKLLAILVFILGVIVAVIYITGDLNLFSFFNSDSDKFSVYKKNEISQQLEKKIDQEDIVEFVKGVPDHSVIEWQIEKKTLILEVVNTPESITNGLSGRRYLEDTKLITLDNEEKLDGMLFVFDDLVKTSFWMKDMLFAIDLFWIKNGEIIGVEKNILPPADLQSQENLLLFKSPGLVDMVLEVPVIKNP